MGVVNLELVDLAYELFEGCEALDESNPGFWVPAISCMLEDMLELREADEMERMAWLYSEDIHLPRLTVSNRSVGLILGLWTPENCLSDDAPGWSWAYDSEL